MWWLLGEILGWRRGKGGTYSILRKCEMVCWWKYGESRFAGFELADILGCDFLERARFFGQGTYHSG